MNGPSPAAIRHLVIAGRDAPLWLSAAVMHSALAPAGVEVTAVELPPRAQPADLCISQPALEPLHSRLRIDESRLIAATRGAFTLGRRFVDASGQSPAFFHAHGSNGSRIAQKEFLPHWLRARREGMTAPFGDFSLTAAAARQGRLLLPDSAIDGFGFIDYGYHLPAIPYGAWLREFALRRGVRTHAARTLEVIRGDSGNITALQTEGRRIAGDFFLDATGSEGLLADAVDAEQESWRHRFAGDRVLTAHTPLLSPVPIYSEVRAQASGWTSLAASQLCMHVQQVYASEFTSDAEALQSLAGIPLQGVHVREHHPRRRLRAWVRNCVALGDAACVLDPVHAVDLHAVQMGLVHLVPLFPVQSDYTVEREEYNANMRAGFERLRDFQSAHYLLARYGLAQDGEPGASRFWTRARAALPGAELAHKIDAFRARGEGVDYEHETFGIDDWQSLLIGHGVLPESWDPAADRTSAELLASEMRRVLAFIRQKVGEQQSHADYLAQVCAPPRPNTPWLPPNRIQ